MARISTVPLVLTLLLLGLLAEQGFGRPSNEGPDYKEDDYANDDYDDSEEDPDTDTTVPTPKMLSESKDIAAHEGETVALPCEPENIDQVLQTYAIFWKKGDKVLFTDKQRGQEVDPRVSYHVQNNSLVIHNIKKEDTGIYECTVSSIPQLVLQHTVNVYAPAMIKSLEPVGPIHVVKKGSSYFMRCNVVGYPPPTVQWTKRGKHEGSEVVPLTFGPNITLSSVDRRDGGIYECSAENNQGPKATASLTIKVLYSPEITIEEDFVGTGEGYDANLKCFVHAEPKATVNWLKNNVNVVPSERIQESQHGHVHTLSIKKVMPGDFGKYVCRANNSLGVEASTDIDVTRKPNTPRFISGEIGPDGKSMDLEWHIVSYSPMIGYKLLYKQVKAGETWTTVEPSVTEPGSSNVYKLKHRLENLPPGDFLVSLRAGNDYGWSPQAKPHAFKIMEKEEKNPEATAETSKQEQPPIEQQDEHNDSTRPRIMAILTIISLSSFFL